MIKLSVDLGGADRGEKELANGAFSALSKNPDLFLYLSGKETDIREIAAEYPDIEGRYRILPAEDVITNMEDPVKAFHAKKDASVVKAYGICKEDPEVQGVVSCGATGAVFVGAVLSLPRIKKLQPVLLCEIIRDDGEWMAISDCGANVDCPPERMLNFATVASLYMEAKGRKNPKVMLLSNGAEKGKGNAVGKQAYTLLSESGLNFAGNIEGVNVLSSDADVIVCDGFSGNILLKSLEGAAKAALREVEKLSESCTPEEQAVIRNLTHRVYQKYDYNSLGGAVMIGASLPILKGHGAADAKTVETIVSMAYELAEKQVIAKIRENYED